MNRRRKKKNNTEFSKLILHQTMAIFIIQLIAAMVFAWNGKDTSIFVYTIPSTAGIFGATIVFYLNKAKIENVFKGKIEFLKFKLDMLNNSPTEYHVHIASELQKIDESLDSKIDSTMNEAVQEEIKIQNF